MYSVRLICVAIYAQTGISHTTISQDVYEWIRVNISPYIRRLNIPVYVRWCICYLGLAHTRLYRRCANVETKQWLAVTMAWSRMLDNLCKYCLDVIPNWDMGDEGASTSLDAVQLPLSQQLLAYTLYLIETWEMKGLQHHLTLYDFL